MGKHATDCDKMRSPITEEYFQEGRASAGAPRVRFHGSRREKRVVSLSIVAQLVDILDTARAVSCRFFSRLALIHFRARAASFLILTAVSDALDAARCSARSGIRMRIEAKYPA